MTVDSNENALCVKMEIYINFHNERLVGVTEWSRGNGPINCLNKRKEDI